MASHFEQIVREANKDGTPARSTPTPESLHVAHSQQSEIRRRLPPFNGAYQHVQGRLEFDKTDLAIALSAAGVAVRLADLL